MVLCSLVQILHSFQMARTQNKGRRLENLQKYEILEKGGDMKTALRNITGTQRAGNGLLVVLAAVWPSAATASI